MSIRTHATAARRWPHGSRLHQDAMTGLMAEWRHAHPLHLNPTLEELWAWVDDQLGERGIDQRFETLADAIRHVRTMVWGQPEVRGCTYRDRAAGGCLTYRVRVGRVWWWVRFDNYGREQHGRIEK